MPAGSAGPGDRRVSPADPTPDWAGTLRRASAIDLLTVGRRSGRPHRVTVWFAYHHGALYILAHARAHRRGTDWYRNLMAAGAATVVSGGSRIQVAPADFPSGVDAHGFTVGLLEAKYGAGTIDTWYDPALRIPVRLVPG